MTPSKAAILLILLAIPALAFTGADVTLMQQAHALPEPFLKICLTITELGKSEYYLVPTALFALFNLWRSRRARILCKRARYGRRMVIGVYIFAAVAVSGLATDLLKFIIGRARPKEFLEHGIYGTHPFTAAARFNSFPSGHATTMMALAMTVTPFLPARWRAPWLAFCAIVIATRPLLAAHYVSDVMGGALVAALTCAWLQQAALKRYPALFTHLPEPTESTTLKT